MIPGGQSTPSNPEGPGPLPDTEPFPFLPGCEAPASTWSEWAAESLLLAVFDRLTEEPEPPVLSPWHAGVWEITPEHAEEWSFWRACGWGGSAALTAMAGDEYGLLLSDLDCYAGLVRRAQEGRGPKPPPLEEYLRPGREDWGHLGQLARLITAELREMLRWAGGYPDLTVQGRA